MLLMLNGSIESTKIFFLYDDVSMSWSSGSSQSRFDMSAFKAQLMRETQWPLVSVEIFGKTVTEFSTCSFAKGCYFCVNWVCPNKLHFLLLLHLRS